MERVLRLKDYLNPTKGREDATSGSGTGYFGFNNFTVEAALSVGDVVMGIFEVSL